MKINTALMKMIKFPQVRKKLQKITLKMSFSNLERMTRKLKGSKVKLSTDPNKREGAVEKNLLIKESQIKAKMALA